MGGVCSDEIAAYRVVCSSNCGSSSVNQRVSNSSGNSNAGRQCKSTATCTYDGVRVCELQCWIEELDFDSFRDIERAY